MLRHRCRDGLPFPRRYDTAEGTYKDEGSAPSLSTGTVPPLGSKLLTTGTDNNDVYTDNNDVYASGLLGEAYHFARATHRGSTDTSGRGAVFYAPNGDDAPRQHTRPTRIVSTVSNLSFGRQPSEVVVPGRIVSTASSLSFGSQPSDPRRILSPVSVV